MSMPYSIKWTSQAPNITIIGCRNPIKSFYLKENSGKFPAKQQTIDTIKYDNIVLPKGTYYVTSSSGFYCGNTDLSGLEVVLKNIDTGDTIIKLNKDPLLAWKPWTGNEEQSFILNSDTVIGPRVINTKDQIGYAYKGTSVNIELVGPINCPPKPPCPPCPPKHPCPPQKSTNNNTIFIAFIVILSLLLVGVLSYFLYFK